MLKKKSVIFIAAGGTGGHVFPALAVAAALREAGVSVLWLGTATGFESKIAKNEGFEYLALTLAKLRGSLAHSLCFPWRFLKSLLQAFFYFRRYRPVCLLSFGGYVTAPAGLAAVLTGTTLFLHEQNAVMGLVNRCLAPFARYLFLSFETVEYGKKILHCGSKQSIKTVNSAHRFLPCFSVKALSKKSILTGNPLRATCLSLPKKKKQSETSSNFNLLILGGSQGAHFLNSLLPRVIQRLSANISVWHQTGKNERLATQQLYTQLAVQNNLRLVPFIEDMAEAYAWADLVIARAGATTLAEMTCAGCPSILVPYPYATAQHQAKNAAYYAQKGAASVLIQDTLTVEKLLACITHFYENRPYLEEMAALAQKVGKPHATQDIFDICMGTLAARSSEYCNRDTHCGKN